MSSRLKEERRQQLAKARRRRRLLYGGAAIVVLLVLGAVIYSRVLNTIPEVEELGPQDQGHAQNVSIADEGLPPAGGTHDPAWLNCGVYRNPVDTGQAVHSLEHGAVWLAYSPELPADQIEQLETYGDEYVLVAPYPGLEHDAVLTAWAARLRIDSLPDERIGDFISRFQGQGPEPGALCSGGVGTPIN